MPYAAASRPRSRGFTLIEVMITVAIIAILASVAVPSYKDYIRRGQQPEAFNALSDFRAKMEQYYQDNRGYGTGTSTTCAPDSTASSWNAFAATARFGYVCATDGATQQSYTITATGTAGQVNGDKYRIDQLGNRTTTKFKGATVSANCWLTSSSSC
ncbi:type IV pilin protein [Variovorax robiniae]|uniref:Type IV pilin protein n=1 Tax=Variovorax robiniae TaxID=1836199 RepID=A0ABU8XH81_9BURK